MALASSAPTVGLAAFYGSGDQGSSHDVGQVEFWYCRKDFPSAGKEGIGFFVLEWSVGLIINNHGKILS